MMNPLNTKTPIAENKKDPAELLNKKALSNPPMIKMINPVVSIPPKKEKSLLDMMVYNESPAKIIPVRKAAFVTVCPLYTSKTGAVVMPVNIVNEKRATMPIVSFFLAHIVKNIMANSRMIKMI